jgi:type III secretory pathway lipoprotein EscJ
MACKESIVHNLAEVEANKILTQLHVAGIAGNKNAQSDGKWSIEVNESEALEAIKYLNDIRVIKSSLNDAHDKPGFMSSREQQQHQYEKSLSKDLELTLVSIDGVLDARVHLSLPLSDPLLGVKVHGEAGSGAILLVVGEGFTYDDRMISQLVAKAAGIKESNISLLLNRQTLKPKNIEHLIAVNDELNTTYPLSAQNYSSSWSQFFRQIQIEKKIALLASFLFVMGIVVLMISRRSFKKEAQAQLFEKGAFYDTARDMH